MATWVQTLDVSDVWGNATDGGLNIQGLSKIVAERLAALEPYSDNYVETARKEFIENFEALAEDDTADADDFDQVWDDLYDWGDISLDGRFNGRKVCWIKIY